MNVETYIYSIFAMILGMLVVFLFLAFLSFLMASLKAIFKEKAQILKKGEKAPVEGRKGDKEQLRWLIAAVSAYLAVEEEQYYPYSAGLWKAGKMDQYNPWIAEGKFLNKGIGV